MGILAHVRMFNAARPSSGNLSPCSDAFLRFETRTRTTGSTTTTSYHFVGYVSAYPFWCYPDNIRLRLRQVTAFQSLFERS